MAAQSSPSNMELEQFQWDETSLAVGCSLLREGPWLSAEASVDTDASCQKATGSVISSQFDTMFTNRTNRAT
ncbi:hypothetical protein FAGAP_10150 [Fusarium agapanthi]|uniref:Uncharacterized protein n=1 Tax=Fusarium agapanthi TaxID=1803897 RepID=A0A9P5B2H8_9HYPO|nr:hypothetical protein FAGAP_10150 [Fusarium agapanthi]